MPDGRNGTSYLDGEIANRPRLVGRAEKRERLASLHRSGMPPGAKTGWPSLDQHYTVATGQMTIVTGWPSSGKSEWLDALLINLAKQGFKIAVFSAENQPVELHMAKMLEKCSGRPFREGPSRRMTLDEVDEYSDELDQSFRFMEVESGALSPAAVLESALPWLDSFEPGTKRGLVIDPWNELEHWRPANLSETEYVSKTLSMIRNWARTNDIHVWIVAHPQKLPRDKGKLPIPTPDTISGSQHWWNKADCALTVWRDLSDLHSQDVTIFVQKVRFKHIGRTGFAVLKWDRVSGRYHEPMGNYGEDK